MKQQFFALTFLISLLASGAAGQQAVKLTTAEKNMAEAITAAQIKDYLYFVASDVMEGRDTPSRGLDTTAEFLRLMLSRWGFKPAGDAGSFFQKIALRSEVIDPAGTSLQVNGQSYSLNEDFFRFGGNGTASGKLVFARDGWLIKSKGIDAFAGVDVTGKIAVLYSDGFPRQPNITALPKGVKREDLVGTKGTDWADPVTYARAKGAAGIIVIAPPQIQAAWTQVRNFLSRGSTYPEKLRERPTDSTEQNFPVMLVSEKVGNAILAGESGSTASTSAFDISKPAAISTAVRIESKSTQNVVALWEGSDPVLKNEMVAIGAHYDHAGTNLNTPGPDKIWNGADDDGSGTVTILSIAEALAKAKMRPKRSVLLVWHVGEEKGLWGSEYFNKFPTVDIKNVVAQLNIDMVGRSRKDGDTNPKNADLSGPSSVYVIGTQMMSTTLGDVVRNTNSGYLKMNYDFRYDDPADKNRFFFRSDHFNYAVNGIPIAFWFDGVHEDYHQPGDEPQKIDYAKMEKIARTVFLTLWEVSDLKTRPKVDKQLPPELMQR